MQLTIIESHGTIIVGCLDAVKGYFVFSSQVTDGSIARDKSDSFRPQMKVQKIREYFVYFNFLSQIVGSKAPTSSEADLIGGHSSPKEHKAV